MWILTLLALAQGKSGEFPAETIKVGEATART